MVTGLLSLLSDQRRDIRSLGEKALDLGEPTMATGAGRLDLVQGTEIFAMSKDFGSEPSLVAWQGLALCCKQALEVLFCQRHSQLAADQAAAQRPKGDQELG